MKSLQPVPVNSIRCFVSSINGSIDNNSIQYSCFFAGHLTVDEQVLLPKSKHAFSALILHYRTLITEKSAGHIFMWILGCQLFGNK